jgi:hypothetical protein
MRRASLELIPHEQLMLDAAQKNNHRRSIMHARGRRGEGGMSLAIRQLTKGCGSHSLSAVMRSIEQLVAHVP